MEIIGANGADAPGGDDLVRDGTDQSFMADVIEPSREVPVLVDFWAPWCGPCRQLGPTIERAVAKAGGKVKLVKVNIDENQEPPPKYGVRGIPTLMLFKNGNVEATKVGALSKSQLAAFLDSNI